MRSHSRNQIIAAAVAGLALWMGMAYDGMAQGPAGAQSNGSMPFSNIVRRPSLSPYTALGFQGSNPNTGSTLGAMQGLVRPQQQQYVQLQQSVRQSRQLNQMQGQMRNMQRSTGGTTLQTIRATGHASTYMDLSHCYPSAR